MRDADRFLEEGRPRWAALDALLRGGISTGAEWEALSMGYRSVCADLSRARALELGEEPVRALDQLAARAHDRLYGGARRSPVDLVGYVLSGVPRQVRAHGQWVALSALLFYAPFVVCFCLGFADEALAERIVDGPTLQSMEAMYAEPPQDRGFADAAAMAGFYVANNVGIALRCFATGALGGLGSVFFLVTNGATIGTVFGHLAREGRGGNLMSFVAGHAAWELWAIVLAGAAGLRLGSALIDTGGATVRASLRAVAPALLHMVVGAAFMLLVAAAIEGFWSASPVPGGVKVVFGLSQVAVVAAWWAFGGRPR